MTRNPRLPLLAAVALAAGLAAAKPNVPELELAYAPTDAPTELAIVPTGKLTEEPVRLVVLDGRTGSPDWIGTRTDDGDLSLDLRATNDVRAWLDESLRDFLRAWGVRIEDDARRTLEAELVELKVTERNRPFGAEYAGDVRVRFALSDPSGLIWEGTTSGQTSRRGRKFSAANASEVLSDALLGVVTQTFAASGFEARETPAPVGPSLTPAKLLAEVTRLIGEGVGEETILRYVREQRLASPLSADDIVAWKSSGVSETIVREALALPVAR